MSNNSELASLLILWLPCSEQTRKSHFLHPLRPSHNTYCMVDKVVDRFAQYSAYPSVPVPWVEWFTEWLWKMLDRACSFEGEGMLPAVISSNLIWWDPILSDFKEKCPFDCFILTLSLEARRPSLLFLQFLPYCYGTPSRHLPYSLATIHIQLIQKAHTFSLSRCGT